MAVNERADRRAATNANSNINEIKPAYQQHEFEFTVAEHRNVDKVGRVLPFAAPALRWRSLTTTDMLMTQLPNWVVRSSGPRVRLPAMPTQLIDMMEPINILISRLSDTVPKP